ncbi:MAG: DEAD/DEAH box helicase [Treponema sp.]|uniref:DNA repair helicase XPB n=1 Tax=Treponema sp. TaxID=166 RepID=UPI00298DFBA8|nr:DNA repair helicase XPB [Treponema sp.]MCQ2599952.1 DEAD/DEAH box helicase [Treponema sp.]
MQNNFDAQKMMNPLIVQSDRSILMDVHAPLADECRNALIPFAELERSPEHLHTYRLTPLSLWNATSAGFTYQDAIDVLRKYSRFDVPQSVEVWIEETAGRFGKLRMIPAPDEVVEFEKKAGHFPDDVVVINPGNQVDPAEEEKKKKNQGKEEYLLLVAETKPIYKQINANTQLRKYLTPCQVENAFILLLTDRGTIKQKLIELGWPVKDEVPLRDGEPLDVSLNEKTSSGKDLVIRNYQMEAAKAIVGDKGPGSGFGTIVLPCGAGKTIVGMTIMSMLKTSTLIITTNITSVHQWIDELVDKTNIPRDMIAEYTGESKTIKPVTVATYQILTWRPDKVGPYPHFSIFRDRPWGLIIYDEVHLLPAPVFRVVAELQAVRRVGLTATLVREDNCQGYVFSLVGPKRYDVPWKELEHTGWIAKAECVEVRLDLPTDRELEYAVAPAREKHRIACENPVKIKIVSELVERFKEDKILIIGQYLDQLEEISALLKVPLITGKTPNSVRDQIYGDFKSGKTRVLVVSKVANFAVDLPDASMAIQVSGTFGSRQEEAQRLGRILRPKERTSRFFTLISRSTVEEDFGSNRQKFLAEQGYSYRIIKYTDASSFDVIKDDFALCDNGEI